MGKGQIIYTPRQTQALVLDGAHYLSLDEPQNNLGTALIGLDALLQVDQNTGITIPAGKYAPDWSVAGYALLLDTAQLKVGFTISNPEGALWSPPGVFALGSRFWAAAAANADGLLNLYVNGAKVFSQAAQSYPSSNDGFLDPDGQGFFEDGWFGNQSGGGGDNDELFYVGRNLIGSLDFLRVDQGRLLPDSWYAGEWDRLRFGVKRPETHDESDFLEIWGFQDDLLAISAQVRTLTWNGGGAPAFAAGWPFNAGPIIAPFTADYQLGAQRGRRQTWTDDYALNGALRRYFQAPKKGRMTLDFKFPPYEQYCALEAALDAGNPVEFFRDADLPRDFMALVTKLPEYEEQYPGDLFQIVVDQI